MQNLFQASNRPYSKFRTQSWVLKRGAVSLFAETLALNYFSYIDPWGLLKISGGIDSSISSPELEVANLTARSSYS